MAGKVFTKFSWKLELRRTYWRQIFAPCSCKDHPTAVSALPHDSPALSLPEYLPFTSDIEQFHHRTAGRQNVLTRGLLSPHQNLRPLTFHHLARLKGKITINRTIGLYLPGMATLSFPSLLPRFCHPFPSADTSSPFVLPNALAVSVISVLSLSAPTWSSWFVPLHSEPRSHLQWPSP